MENESFLKVEKIGHVAWLILNRPKQRNTMTWSFFRRCAGFLKNSMQMPMCVLLSSGHREKALPPAWTLLRPRLSSGMARPFTVTGSAGK